MFWSCTVYATEPIPQPIEKKIGFSQGNSNLILVKSQMAIILKKELVKEITVVTLEPDRPSDKIKYYLELKYLNLGFSIEKVCTIIFSSQKSNDLNLIAKKIEDWMHLKISEGGF